MPGRDSLPPLPCRKDVVKKYLTTAEVAERYRTSPATIRYSG
jgi:hypothetical protein